MMEMVRNAVFNMVMSLYGCSAALPEEARCVRGGGGLWGCVIVLMWPRSGLS